MQQTEIKKSGALERLNRLKTVQGKRAGAASARRVDQASEARRKEEEETLTPTGEIERIRDDIARLMHVLRKHDFTEEDARTVERISTLDEAKGIRYVLQEALESRSLQLPDDEDWMVVKRMAMEDRAHQERVRQREEARVAKIPHRHLVEQMAIQEYDLPWVATMLDALPPGDRQNAVDGWNARHNDHSIAREGDRYREANIYLMGLAVESNPSVVRALQKKKRATV